MQLFDLILEGWQAESESAAIEWARGFDWCDCETSESVRPTHSRHIESVGGVGLWYDYGADYYFFEDEIRA